MQHLFSDKIRNTIPLFRNYNLTLFQICNLKALGLRILNPEIERSGLQIPTGRSFCSC